MSEIEFIGDVKVSVNGAETVIEQDAKVGSYSTLYMLRVQPDALYGGVKIDTRDDTVGVPPRLIQRLIDALQRAL